MTHRIALRGPWEFEWLTPPVGTVATGRGALPADWLELWGPHIGRVAWHRWFHRPTGLEADERVWVVVEGPEGGIEIRLNDMPIEEFGRGGRLQVDLTTQLQARNRLSVVLTVGCADEIAAANLTAVSLMIGRVDE